ncbi:Crp/Fnr family transcriptional regulator [Candidatus Gottesmanbacteria bacterium]|nr:Crp/Fnr family transcriptional regulator [Candidatus Gottesmanbacteria bacterium]
MDAPDTSSVRSFFTAYPRHSFRPGEAIIREDETPSGIYYISSGLVRQYSLTPKGEMTLVYIFRPGSFFPMMWALTGMPNTYQYEAVDTVEVYHAPKDDVLAYLSAHPNELLAFTRRVAAGLAGLVNRLEYMMFGSAYRKTVLLLCYFAKTFGKKEGTSFVFPMCLTHREVAAWIGTTRETVTMQMERLKHKGLIATRGRTLVIKNFATLEKEEE